MDFDNSGLGSSDYNVFYDCRVRTEDMCVIIIRIIDTRKYIGLYTKKYYYNYKFEFDCSITATVYYSTDEVTIDEE